MSQEQIPSATGEEAAMKAGEDGPPLPLRRSGRVRRRPSDHREATEAQDRPTATSPSASAASRKPKRKAAPEAFEIPDHLLDVSLGPWKEKEQAEWPSWVELESEPDFFTGILGLLDVKGVKVEEVLSVDEDSLAALPHPVYGLVFLYEYVSEDGPGAAETSGSLWFANQTTQNACATIALLNIIMNAEGLALGEKLHKFKQDSMGLPPPLRGNMIANSEWIRMAHNSYARRLDLLNAALSLQNEVDRKKKRAKSLSSRRKKTKSKSPTDEDSPYHFTAFVPVGQQVWQLDGFTPAPVCVGEYAPDQRWTSVMRQVLEDRMMRYETERLSFSLLALCSDPLTPIRQRLAANVRRLEALEAKYGSNPDWSAAVLALTKAAADEDYEVISSTADERLAAYQLDGENAPPGDDAPGRLPKEEEKEEEIMEEALKQWENYGEEQRRIRAEYENEMKMSAAESGGIFGRTLDYTAAIHEWVKKLADHGVLKKLHEEVQLHT
ncbi:hypothetical protein VTK26DRAFT_8134 [Humicola hyalothermophila]